MKKILVQSVILLQAVVALAIPDNFASRQVLTGASTSAVNNNQTATTEVGEPSDTGLKTMWYSWTAPANGELTITLAGGDAFAYQLSVWMGSSVTSLKEVFPAVASGSATVTFPVVAGTVYAICTGSAYSGYYGNIQINLNLDTGSTINTLNIIGTATTTNDLFANRIITTTSFGSYVVYNLSSSRETLEPTSGYQTMWWTYHAPATGQLTVTTDGSWSFSKTISVWNGIVMQNLHELTGDAVGSSLTLPVIAGTDYQICVATSYSGYGGPMVVSFLLDSNSDLNSFNLSGGAVCTNNNFASAYALTGDSPAVVSYNTYATREALEPSNNGYKTIWFKWTAPVAGTAQMLTQGSDASYSKLVTVYTGTAINNLVQVIQSSPSTTASVSFSAIAGQTYYISVAAAYSGYDGPIVFSIFGQPGALATGPNLTIEKAVHLKFQTQSGHTYRVQQSSDLKTWNSLTNVFTGNGAVQDIYVGGTDTGNRSFRVSAQ